VGFRFESSKLLLSFTIALFISCYFARFSSLQRKTHHKLSSPRLPFYFFPALILFFMMAIGWRFSSIFLITVTIFCQMPSFLISANLNRLASSLYPFMMLLLVPISCLYASSYIQQSLMNDPYPIGSYLFP